MGSLEVWGVFLLRIRRIASTRSPWKCITMARKRKAEQAPVASSSWEASADYFDTLMDHVPASYYYPDPSKAANIPYTMKNSKKVRKEVRDVQKSEKQARKRARLAGANELPASALEVQQEMLEMKSDDEPAVGMTEKLEALRKRLQSRIESKRSDRGDVFDGEGSKKEKRKERDAKKKQMKRQKQKANKKKFLEKTGGAAAAETTEPEQNATTAIDPEEVKSATANVDDVIDLQFQKFDFTTVDDVIDNAGKKPRKKPTTQSLLKKAERLERKLNRVEDDSERAKLKADQQWDAALKKASGEKVRDDVKLLKKTLKSEKRKKERSKKKWQERLSGDKESPAPKGKGKQNRAGFEGKHGSDYLNKKKDAGGGKSASSTPGKPGAGGAQKGRGQKGRK